MPDYQGFVALVLEDGQLPTDTTARALRLLLVDAAGTAVSDSTATALPVTVLDASGATVTDTASASLQVTMVDAGGTNITDTTYNVLNVKKYTVSVASSTDTLDTSGVYTGAGVNIKGLEKITGYVAADQGGNINVRQSGDDTNWDISDTTAIVGGTTSTFSVDIESDYASVVYTNGDTAQGSMRLYARAR